MRLSYKHSPPLLLSFLCLLGFVSAAQALTKHGASNKKISALLVFGDSTVDPGNNNYVGTAFKSNFPPYGREFLNQIPTGRFTDGRLPTDFVASYVGVKEYVPPYLDPTLSILELMTGVSFASAGTGFDPLTPTISGVIPIPKQLEYFRQYKRRLESAIGKRRTEDHIKNALFFISAGTNDFVLNYFTLPIRRQTYTVSSYQQFVLQLFKEFIQGLWDEGARKIMVPGLGPIGCLPIVITLNSNNANLQRGCVEEYSSVARGFNLKLQQELNFMQLSLANQGFDEVNVGCCGTGYLEASFLCNPKSYVCPDVSKYIFWDSVHPTEKVYRNLFQASRPVIDILVNS
ncbi:hypothetical protein CJ030_MR2G018495 [Morella rubra]|uniref:GDSL esterase/lipase n=1 Tax=Morella rubra TaxID=262757 RepID=A0A6A1WAU3_9ROSI|nr:hypothetical protein CJ030_MR2G018495 [Morella rubra]